MRLALLASCMLVLQVLLGAYATGAAAAAPPMLDAFGNVLCITSTDAADHGSADHTALPDCCTVACGMFAPIQANDRTGHSLSNPLPTSVLREPAAFDNTGQAFALEQRPGSARSPPSRA